MAYSSTNIQLLIVSKSPYHKQSLDPRWCYLGIDKQTGIIYRPIPPLNGPEERGFFWPQQYNFQVGETHEFEVLPLQAPSMVNWDTLPHRNNDVQVIHKGQVVQAGVLNMAGIFQLLGGNARGTMEETLGVQGGVILTSFTGGQYVVEGTKCQSFGIVKYARQVALPPPNALQEDLVIYELARPLCGNMMFDPRRCFLKEVGTVLNS